MLWWDEVNAMRNNDNSGARLYSMRLRMTQTIKHRNHHRARILYIGEIRQHRHWRLSIRHFCGDDVISQNEEKENKVLPRFELGSLDSKSRVLTITPWNPMLQEQDTLADQNMSALFVWCVQAKICLFPAGFEPATLCVWSTRDNRYTKETTAVLVWNICSPGHEWCTCLLIQTDQNWKLTKITIIPSGDRTQDLWIRSPTRYPLR